jgi:hypothetical protein
MVATFAAQWSMANGLGFDFACQPGAKVNVEARSARRRRLRCRRGELLPEPPANMDGSVDRIRPTRSNEM